MNGKSSNISGNTRSSSKSRQKATSEPERDQSTDRDSIQAHQSRGATGNVNTADMSADRYSEDSLMDSLMQRLELLENDNIMKDAHIKLLYSKINMLEKNQRQHHDAQNDLTTRSMNQNIVISGTSDILKEKPRQDNCKAIVEKIVSDYLHIREPGKVTVIRAHRLGHSNDDGKIRPIVARLAGREMVGEVLKRGGQLAGLDIFINPQYPPIIEERRTYIQSYRKTARNAGATAKVSHDKLYVNNELQRQLLPPTIPPSIPPSIPDLPEVKMSQFKDNDNCKIQLILAPSTSIEQVGPALDAALLKSPNPPHRIAYAFRFTNASQIYRNYDSGTEPGVGLRLLKLLDRKMINNQTAILHIWHKSQGKGKGPDFYDNVEIALDEILNDPSWIRP